LLTEPSVAVSHTVHDLVFIWNYTQPLVVNPDIELPQLDISNNFTADCTIEYSTGVFLFGYLIIKPLKKFFTTECLQITLISAVLVVSVNEAKG